MSASCLPRLATRYSGRICRSDSNTAGSASSQVLDGMSNGTCLGALGQEVLIGYLGQRFLRRSCQKPRVGVMKRLQPALEDGRTSWTALPRRSFEASVYGETQAGPVLARPCGLQSIQKRLAGLEYRLATFRRDSNPHTTHAVRGGLNRSATLWKQPNLAKVVVLVHPSGSREIIVAVQR